jgi:hypothetical protein
MLIRLISVKPLTAPSRILPLTSIAQERPGLGIHDRKLHEKESTVPYQATPLHSRKEILLERRILFQMSKGKSVNSSYST